MRVICLKAGGTFEGYLLESRRNLIELSACKQVELHRNLWKQRLRLWERILCPMRTAPGRTRSGRRPSPEVPRPDGINHSSSAIDNRSASRRASRGPDASAETCEKVPAGRFSASGSDRNAHIHLAQPRSEITSELSRTFRDSRITCRTSDTSEDLFGLYPYNTAAARTIFAFIVRAAWYS